jgi:hypothetical protein
MLKNIQFILIAILISSCAMMNEDFVHVPIKSNPSGANVYLGGKYYGTTPMQLKLIPDKNYKATLVKKGYGSSNLLLETWPSVRGGRGADTTRCVLDALGIMLIIPAASFFSVHCRDFKKREYLVNIGRNDFSAPQSPNQRIDMDHSRQQVDPGNYYKEAPKPKKNTDLNKYNSKYNQNYNEYQ